MLVEMANFTPSIERVKVPASGSAPALRTVLKAGGFAESVVVTARRVETRVTETPQKIEVVDAADIERTGDRTLATGLAAAFSRTRAELG